MSKRIPRYSSNCLAILAAILLSAPARAANRPAAKQAKATATSAKARGGEETVAATAAMKASATGQAASAQTNDAEYTAKIREYTTEPYLLTPLVDHLPASATVPTPEKILGYAIGTPDKLTHTADIYKYYRALAQASPRVRVFTTGKSEEGRDFMLVAVSDEANIAQLDHYRDVTAKLADPRKITPADAEQLASTGKPFYWLSGSIHSPETGSPEMLMELAYRLAVEDSPQIEQTRKNVIVLITPVLEVDGRDREVDLYNWEKANPGKPAPSLIYWGHYVAHDNNRDAIGMALELSKIQMKTFLAWHPQVLHDLHESEPFLYISTGTGPYNAWLDPIVVSEWQEMAYNEVQKMTEFGVPGVWTFGFYDGWAPNYMFFVAQGHNSIGRFYETFGGRGADTGEQTVPAEATTRTWYRPNPPLAKINWSIRDNVNLQQSGLLIGLNYMAQRPEQFLQRFYDMSRRAVAKATTEGPAAWAILNDGKRPALAAHLARSLQEQGVEVDRLDGEFSVKTEKPATAAGGAGARPESRREMRGAKEAGEHAPEETKIPAGSYIIRMDQPYSREADMLLDTQYYSIHDPAPYDDTGWTLGALEDVATLRLTDTGILKAPMTLVDGPARAKGDLQGAGKAKFYLVNANAEPALATLRFALRDAKMFAAEDAFKADGKEYRAGTFIIPAEGNRETIADDLGSDAQELGLDIHATAENISVARHPLEAPRIAIEHNWMSTQPEGWFRLALESCKVPYTYISDATIRETPNLREKFDVIVMPPSTPNLARLVSGVPKRMLRDGSDAGGPIPWEKSELTPSFALGPDESSDIRGGLGFSGLANLEKFVEDGGLLMPISSSSVVATETGITDTVSIEPTPGLHARGAIFNATVEDPHDPITYGYDAEVPVYFNQAPVFRVSLGGGGGFGGGGGELHGRPSGRGSLTDPDIPQGRPWNPPAPEPHRTRAEQELYVNPETRQFLSAFLPPKALWPHVVLRFADEKNLWVSGMLDGGQALAEAPAIVDVPLGRGHVVLFAINPMWRQITQGSFMFVLNAAMNYDHLGVMPETTAAH
ncbi:MAG TPA: M14 family zinc carboxypeptidase [Candidatus Acidoferrales bacterium]|nr:M14 family zinc carboxypeptidase [Candidatus Acidoferrales bacterium]